MADRRRAIGRFTRHIYALALAITVCGLLAPTTGWAFEDNARAQALAAIDTFNQHMRQVYADTRSEMLAATTPVIIVGFDTVTLLHDGDRDEQPYTPAVYHQLKATSHMVLGMVGAVLPAVDGPADTAWLSRLAEIRDQVDTLQPHIDALDFSAAQAARQHQLLDETRAFIDDTLAGDVLDRARLGDFLRETKPLWLANMTDAAVAQLDMLHAVVSDWREAMAPEDWERLYVMVLGPRMPRAEHLQTAYFRRLLGAYAEGERVIYAENMFDATSAHNLLGVIVIDRALSELAFGDPYRMDRDALGYAAQTYLDALLP